MGQIDSSSPDSPHKKPSTGSIALRLALGYCIVGLLWITFSSSLSQKLGSNIEAVTYIESIKGWLFVGATTIGWYFVLRRALQRVSELDQAISKQHQQAQAEIAEYRKLLEAAEDNIVLYDNQKRYLTVTDRVAALAGTTSQEMIGKSFERLPDRPSVLNEALDQVLSSGKTQHTTIRVPQKDHDLWFETIYTPILDDENQITSILVVGRDVTTRVLAEEKLRERTEQYKALYYTISLIRNTLWFDEVLDGLLAQMWMVEADSHEIFHNEQGSLRRVAGNDSQQRDDPDRDQGQAIPDMQLNLDDHQTLYEALETATVIRGQLVRGDSHPWLSDNAPACWMIAPMIVRGNITGFLSVGRQTPINFTEVEEESLVALANSAAAAIDNAQLYENLERSEADYRQLIDSVDDVIYRANADGIVTYINTKGRVLQELDEGDSGLVSWREIIHPDDIEDTFAIFNRSLASHESLIFQNRIVGKKGRITYLSHRAKLYYDPNGQYAGVFGIARDISDFVRQENSLAIRAHQQAVVATLGVRVLADVDTYTLMDEIAVVIASTLKVELASVLELLPGGKQLILRAGHGWGNDIIGHLILNVDSKSQAGYALVHHEAVISEDVLAETRFEIPAVTRDRKVRSSISVIIEDSSGPYGVINAQTQQVRAFSPDDISFLQAVANLLAAGIARANFEQALRDSEERNRTVVNAAADGIITLDEHGLIQSFNPAAERLFGYSAAEAQGQDFRTLIAASHQKRYDPTIQPSASREIIGVRRDGTTFTMDLTLSTMVVGGRHMFTSLVRDVTERVKSEQAVAQHAQQLATLNHILQVAATPTDFEQVLEALLSEICDVFGADAADIHLLDDNVNLMYLLAHRGYEVSEQEKFHHFSVNDSLRGQTIIEGRIGVYNKPFPANFQILSYQEDKINAIAITPIWARGSIRGTLAIMLWSKRTFENEQLALLEALGRGIGITIENARLYAEAQSYAELLTVRIAERTEELQKALIHAQSADRAKSALLSTVSHEMRTPLSSIIGFSNLILTRRPEIEKTVEFASAINSEARRLADLINDFLDLQRIEAGREVFHFTQASLGELVKDVVRKQQLEDDDIHTIHLDLQPVPPVHGDMNRLRQVILNLLSNALKYSPNGGDITISLRNVGTEVFFAIKDQGLGISSVDMEQVFDHFYRGETAERNRIRGTGLGLGLCREIIARHNGRIWGDSPGANQGSTFSFALPVAPEYALELQDSENGQYPPTPLQLSQKAIVLIEADTNFSNYITERMALENFAVHILCLQDVSIAHIAEISPALIMLDLVNGDEQSGWAFLELLKDSPLTRDIPILICSSLGILDEARDKGAASFVSKPVDETLLIEEIRRLVA